MKLLDILIISLYFGVVVSLGFVYKKKASKNLDAYFLGGRKLHWLALAMSGSVSNFDITGTMWIVSILFVLGMKSMWHHWMWGFLMGAFFMSYMGRWVRRSQVMTAAEWMRTRFGDDRPGRLSRTTYAFMAILTQASFLGYAFQGIGKFASVYIPLEALASHTSLPWVKSLFTQYEPQFLAVTIISLTTLYVLLGGLYSVVITDVIQTVVLTLSSLCIAVIAWLKLNTANLAKVPQGFFSLHIPWRIPELAGTENAVFEYFGALVIVWVMKGFLMNAGGPAQMYDFQRFLAARNDREASKIGAAWSAFLVVRWALVMGIVMLAITGALGVSDSERVMPVVLRDFLPTGLRGLVIAGLLAAFMSTFSSTVNSGASFIVRDIWQAHLRRRPTEKQAVRFSYAATALLVILGLGIGMQSGSIAEIWNWMMMSLGAGVIIPNVLRWYWWRMNGWGYALGTAGGITLSLIALFFDKAPYYVVFPVIVTASFGLSVLGSLCTPAVDKEILANFYHDIKPFGLWKPFALQAFPQDKKSMKPEGLGNTIANVLLGMTAIASFYLSPMHFIAHGYTPAAFWLGLGLVSCGILKFTWYDNLPK